MKKIKNKKRRENLNPIYFIVALAAFISFFPAFQNEFTNWDDNFYLTENPLVTEFTAKMLPTLLTSSQVGNFHPLTMLTYLI